MSKRLEEFKERRRKILDEMDNILNQMEDTNQEVLRVAEVASETNEILKTLDNQDDYLKIIRGENE